ncbi:MAG: penicillin acylase family protein, partial [Gemmatimonadaceae bacterium]|nr:penicillin acylase family protein [Gemmatimonadaceae bacterium]
MRQLSRARVALFSALTLGLAPLPAEAQQPTPVERARWEATAKRVTIIRDQWGIPHIYGKTDADVVFGAIYS